MAENYDEDKKQIERMVQERRIMAQAEEYMEMNEDAIKYAKLCGDMQNVELKLKDHENNFKKMQKQIEARTTETLVTETIALINAGIHTDPNIIKLLKIKEGNEEEQKSKLKYNGLLFSKKLNQIAESLSVLMEFFKKVDRKTSQLELDLTSIITQKTSYIQQQLDDFRADQVKQNLLANQKLEIALAENNDKIRDIETKTGWKLSEYKTKIEEKINEEKVIQMLQAAEKKFDANMREYQARSNIDPDKIEKIEKDITSNRLSAQNGITENNYRMNQIVNQMQNTLLTKDIFFAHQVQIEKRLCLLNNNFVDVYTRVGKCQNEEAGMNVKINKLLTDTEIAFEEVKRINAVLLNLKIGQDFQRMLEEMDPSKVLELQDTVDDVKSDQISIFKEIEIAKRQIDKINSKNQIAGILIPNKPREKIQKQELEEAINQFLVDNQFARKINLIEGQLAETKANNETVQDLKKRFARIQKESDHHNIVFEMQNLQQYIKRQISLLNGKMKHFQQKSMEKGNRIDRPFSSDRRSEGIKSNSFSFKKLGALNSISSIKMQPNNSLTEKKFQKKIQS